jgi:pilus assembly protein CpaB
MNVARIAVLFVALGAGFLAWSMARNVGGEEHVVVQTTIETDDVLIAARDVQPGERIAPEDLVWERWPRDNIHSGFVRRGVRPGAIDEFEGAIVRSSMLEGEPIRPAKLAREGSGGYLSAALPSGMRAVSTRTSPQTGAGGFILPNDRVDVVLTRRQSSATGRDDYISERVLSNVRVLAIDQTLEEQDGRMVVVGNVATLALRPEQTEILALAEQLGEITLALRSIMDGRPEALGEAPGSEVASGARAGAVSVVKFGVPSRVRAN